MSCNWRYKEAVAFCTLPSVRSDAVRENCLHHPLLTASFGSLSFGKSHRHSYRRSHASAMRHARHYWRGVTPVLLTIARHVSYQIGRCVERTTKAISHAIAFTSLLHPLPLPLRRSFRANNKLVVATSYHRLYT